LESRFLRPSKAILATGAIALITILGSVQASPAQAPAGQQPAAGGQAAGATKNYKDRAEYDLYAKITQTTDPKARLDLLNQWQDKYPQSDYAQERNIYFRETLAQLAPSDPSVRQKLLDKCEEILKNDPKDFRSNFLIAVWGQAVGGTNPNPDLQAKVQTAAQAVIDNANEAFDPSKKPPQVSQSDFEKAKAQALGVAHNALAWVASAKKDNKTASDQYKASLQANPDQGAVSYQFAKMLQEDKSIPDEQKYPTILWEYARAAQYTGTGQVPAASQPQILDYFKKIYPQYHGSTDGMDQLLSQAKASALPPDGFTVGSAAAAANKEAEAINARMASDPAFKIWEGIKQGLTTQGDSFFSGNVKGFEVPGESVPSKTFTGTVISVDPPDRPTKVVLGVEDPTKPDATLIFSQPLAPAALDKLKPGQKIDFSGAAESYTKEPYMLTFSDPTIPGVQTTAPAKKGRRR
jgi:hypothetical protein